MHLLNRIIIAMFSSLIILIISANSAGPRTKSAKSKPDDPKITLIKLEKPELNEANGQSATFKSSGNEYAISKVPLFPVVLKEPRLVGIYYFEVAVKRLSGKVSIGFSTCDGKEGKPTDCRLVQFGSDGILDSFADAQYSFQRKNRTGFGIGDVVGIGLIVSAASLRLPEIFVTVNGHLGVDSAVHERPIRYIYPFVHSAGKEAEIEFNFGRTQFKYDIMSYQILPSISNLLKKKGPVESVIYVSGTIYNARKGYENARTLESVKIVNGIHQELCSDIKIDGSNIFASNSIRIDPAKCQFPASGRVPLPIKMVLSYKLPGTLLYKQKEKKRLGKQQHNSAEKFEADGVYVSHTVKIPIEEKIVDSLFSTKKDNRYIAYIKINCSKILTEGHCENEKSELENIESLPVRLQ